MKVLDKSDNLIIIPKEQFRGVHGQGKIGNFQSCWISTITQCV